MMRPAPATVAPKATPMLWWPRQTPSSGSRPEKALISSTDMPASLGVQGPGEMTSPSGLSASTPAASISSLRNTFSSAP